MPISARAPTDAGFTLLELLVTLTLVWSWIIGPALAYLITLLLPLVLGAVIKVYAGQFAAPTSASINGSAV